MKLMIGTYQAENGRQVILCRTSDDKVQITYHTGKATLVVDPENLNEIASAVQTICDEIYGPGQADTTQWSRVYRPIRKFNKGTPHAQAAPLERSKPQPVPPSNLF